MTTDKQKSEASMVTALLTMYGLLFFFMLLVIERLAR